MLMRARLVTVVLFLTVAFPALAKERRLLYVATPGIRNYVQFGGVGLLVFDIDKGHRFVRRIPTLETQPGQEPENVKGICASAKKGRIYVGTIKRLLCFDLRTDRLLWNREYSGGCDRMAISPDGALIYMPSLEGPTWTVVDAATGDVVTVLEPKSGAHNTVFGPDGKRVYLAGLKSNMLNVADAVSHRLLMPVGPFGNVIRPFTVNGSQTRCYVNVNDLLGFEVGDLTTGKFLCRVEVEGFKQGPVERHGCPSHGVALTPDEKEIWLADAANRRVHVFDSTTVPPKQKQSIELRGQPGWITFGLSGRYAYPSTGEVIDAKTKRIVAALTDELGREVHSEKMVEVTFDGERPVKNADQFGIGRRRR
jgi:DNA-binding beta-propeller fold protein YncE